MSQTKNSESTSTGLSAHDLAESYKRTLAILRRRVEGLRKRSSPALAEAEADLATFLKLLQVAHSLFQEVEELKKAITQIAESSGIVQATTGSLRN